MAVLTTVSSYYVRRQRGTARIRPPHVAAAALSRAAIDRYLMLVVVVVRFFNNNYDKRIVNKASTQCKQQCRRKI